MGIKILQNVWCCISGYKKNLYTEMELKQKTNYFATKGSQTDAWKLLQKIFSSQSMWGLFVYQILFSLCVQN